MKRALIFTGVLLPPTVFLLAVWLSDEYGRAESLRRCAALGTFEQDPEYRSNGIFIDVEDRFLHGPHIVGPEDLSELLVHPQGFEFVETYERRPGARGPTVVRFALTPAHDPACRATVDYYRRTGFLLGNGTSDFEREFVLPSGAPACIARQPIEASEADLRLSRDWQIAPQPDVSSTYTVSLESRHRRETVGLLVRPRFIEKSFSSWFAAEFTSGGPISFSCYPDISNYEFVRHFSRSSK